MIRVQHLHVSLQGKEILHDLSFELPDKKIVMLLGEMEVERQL